MSVARRVGLAGLGLMVLASPVGGAQAADEGEKLFVNHCGTCHSLDPAAGPRQGPNLHGVIGRKAGSLDGFSYSKGLKAAGWTWTPQQMDKWISDPKALIPDTFMNYHQANPATRLKIIDYVKTHS